MSPEEAAKRGGFGNERYETTAFQAKVRENYNKLIEDNWSIVNTDGKSLEQVFNEINDKISVVLNDQNKGPIETLWPMTNE